MTIASVCLTYMRHAVSHIWNTLSHPHETHRLYLYATHRLHTPSLHCAVVLSSDYHQQFRWCACGVPFRYDVGERRSVEGGGQSHACRVGENDWTSAKRDTHRYGGDGGHPTSSITTALTSPPPTQPSRRSTIIVTNCAPSISNPSSRDTTATMSATPTAASTHSMKNWQTL